MPDEFEDNVARRIVMGREVWDTLVHIADAMNAKRGTNHITPTEVASMAIDVGLKTLKRDWLAKKRKRNTCDLCERGVPHRNC